MFVVVVVSCRRLRRPHIKTKLAGVFVVVVSPRLRRRPPPKYKMYLEVILLRGSFEHSYGKRRSQIVRRRRRLLSSSSSSLP